MTRRRWLWLTGLLVVGLAHSLIPWPDELRLAGSVALLCVLVLVGGIVEILVGLRGHTPGSRRTPAPAFGGPADGRVGLARVAGVRSAPYVKEPGFGRFEGTGPGWEGPASDPGRGTPALLGRVVLFSMFVGRDGQGWTEAEIARAHRALIRAGEWIEREAIRWRAPVNIDLADIDFVAEDPIREDVEIAFQPEGDDVGPLEALAIEKAIASASRAAARLGFADVADLVARVNPRVEADACVWLLHLRRAGRSVAAPEADTGLPGVNIAVCFAREASFPEPLSGTPFADPVTFAHELMHLFGARDKYGVSLARFPRKTVTERDVMCLNYESLPRLRVDPRTAMEIGWAGPRADGGAPAPPEGFADRPGPVNPERP